MDFLDRLDNILYRTSKNTFTLMEAEHHRSPMDLISEIKKELKTNDNPRFTKKRWDALVKAIGGTKVITDNARIAKGLISILQSLVDISGGQSVKWLERNLAGLLKNVQESKNFSSKQKAELTKALGVVIQKYENMQKRARMEDEADAEAEATGRIDAGTGDDELDPENPWVKMSLGEDPEEEKSLLSKLKEKLTKSETNEDDVDEPVESDEATDKTTEEPSDELNLASDDEDELDLAPEEEDFPEVPEETDEERMLKYGADGNAVEPQKPKRRESRHRRSGSRNVAIVKQSGDIVLARIRGWKDASKKEVTYKYITVDSDDLNRVTGDPDLDEDNIWNYIKIIYDENPEDFRAQVASDADEAFTRFKKQIVRERGHADTLDDYIQQAVGTTHKDMLINAYRNYVQGNRPPRSGNMEGLPSVSSGVDLLPSLSSLDDEQAVRLLELYPRVKNTKITNDHVKAFLKRMEGRRDPAMLESVRREIISILSEAESEERNGIFDRLQEKLGNLKMPNLFNNGVSNKTKKLVRAAYIYDSLIERMMSDIPKAVRALQTVGVDVANHPELREMAPMRELSDEIEVTEKSKEKSSDLVSKMKDRWKGMFSHSGAAKGKKKSELKIPDMSDIPSPNRGKAPKRQRKFNPKTNRYEWQKEEDNEGETDLEVPSDALDDIQEAEPKAQPPRTRREIIQDPKKRMKQAAARQAKKKAQTKIKYAEDEFEPSEKDIDQAKILTYLRNKDFVNLINRIHNETDLIEDDVYQDLNTIYNNIVKKNNPVKSVWETLDPAKQEKIFEVLGDVYNEFSKSFRVGDRRVKLQSEPEKAWAARPRSVTPVSPAKLKCDNCGYEGPLSKENNKCPDCGDKLTVDDIAGDVAAIRRITRDRGKSIPLWKLGSGAAESYARIIHDNIIVEDARITANDHAKTALKIYVGRCNTLDRESLNEMYDNKSQMMFEIALQKSYKAYNKYRKMLSEYGIVLEEIQEKDLFGKIIRLLQATSDPLSEDQILRADLKTLKEAYHSKLIGKKENGVGYVLLSKIF